MATKQLPSPEVLRQLLRYEPDTGKLFWLPRGGNERFTTTWAGREAFTSTNGSGYKSGSVNRLGMLAHRVIWAMMTGAWPEGEIDHRDTDRQNNRWDNLRPADDAQNARNRNVRSDSRTNIKGVGRLKSGRWQARIMVSGVSTCLGTFGCQTAASLEYAKASQRLHGDFARHAAALSVTQDVTALRAGDLVIRQRDAACG